MSSDAELVAYATDERVDAIVSAIPTATAERRRVGLRASVSVRAKRSWSPHLRVEHAGFDSTTS